MPVWNQVTIVGVGLMGGSIGLALRQRGLARTVIGFARHHEVLEQAKSRGAIDEGTLSLSQAVESAELVVVCTPVDSIIEMVREVDKYAPTSAFITDVGSTKRTIVKLLNESDTQRVDRFIGSHPLAGSEQSGVQSAVADLLVGRTVVVTPAENSPTPLVNRIEEFWSQLGANVVAMNAAEHDRVLAQVSHLPHLVSAALAASTDPTALALAATGWLDTTRIAAGSPDLWLEILLQNRSEILKSLNQFTETLQNFRQAIEEEDRSLLRQQLEIGKNHRDAVGS